MEKTEKLRRRNWMKLRDGIFNLIYGDLGGFDKMGYPNLSEIIKYHPYHISTFASFAEITLELLQAVLNGQADLTERELQNVARYTQVPFKALIAPRLIMLDCKHHKHRKMIESLSENLYVIWEAEKEGSKEASCFMRHGRVDLVNLELAFHDDRATYGRYLGVKKRVEQTLLFIDSENRKCRGIIQRPVSQ